MTSPYTSDLTFNFPNIKTSAEAEQPGMLSRFGTWYADYLGRRAETLDKYLPSWMVPDSVEQKGGLANTWAMYRDRDDLKNIGTDFGMNVVAPEYIGRLITNKLSQGGLGYQVKYILGAILNKLGLGNLLKGDWAKPYQEISTLKSGEVFKENADEWKRLGQEEFTRRVKAYKQTGMDSTAAVARAKADFSNPKLHGEIAGRITGAYDAIHRANDAKNFYAADPRTSTFVNTFYQGKGVQLGDQQAAYTQYYNQYTSPLAQHGEYLRQQEAAAKQQQQQQTQTGSPTASYTPQNQSDTIRSQNSVGSPTLPGKTTAPNVQQTAHGGGMYASNMSAPAQQGVTAPTSPRSSSSPYTGDSSINFPSTNKPQTPTTGSITNNVA